MVTAKQSLTEETIYQGEFGQFTITDSDRLGVRLYRAGLMLAALSFALGTGLVLFQGAKPIILQSLTALFGLFSVGLGISLLTIHIYLIPLHRLLQLFWLTGTISAIILAVKRPEPLAEFVYYHPISLLGIGFIFAALTGIYFKEAFCFNRFETKLLTPIVPLLLLGHLGGILPVAVEKGLLFAWSVLFVIFTLRKVVQAIPPDIGDKSVFEYLKSKPAS